MAAGLPSSDAAYRQLPADLPPRVREMALSITDGYDGAYLKAKAIEAHLRTEYTYTFATSEAEQPLPAMVPVDWFLFAARKGTCGQFSSAFVVLARAAGLPARVVSPTSERQTIYTDQAHQWAEVAFSNLGWVTFEPTASSGGAPSRTPGFEEPGTMDDKEDLPSELEEGLESVAAENPELAAAVAQ